MQLKLMGKKIGMTQVFDESGFVTPVTLIALCPHEFVRECTREKEGYESVVLGAQDIPEKYLKTRHHTAFSKAHLGQFKQAGVKPKKFLFEIHGKKTDLSFPLDVKALENVSYVDVTGRSKGKGFQGAMKRHGHSGGPGAHGTKFVRGLGSTGQNTRPSRVFKNFKMPGHMGFEKSTTQNLRVVDILPEQNCILVQGAVPGVKGAYVFISESKKRGHLV